MREVTPSIRAAAALGVRPDDIAADATRSALWANVAAVLRQPPATGPAAPGAQP